MNNQTMKTLNVTAFWASMAALAAALVCGVLRRTGAAEFPAAVRVWLLPVFTAAAVGYLTNWLAIQLLFRPYRPVKWLGGLQGMIPKRQPDLAETLAEQIPANLMPADRIAFQIRRKLRESMQGPELAERLHAMVAEYIRDERRKQDLSRRIAAILDTAGSAGVEAGFNPAGVRRFYHTYGSGFVKEKVICNKALRSKILDELKGQVPGLIGEIRANMPGLLAEYMHDNPVKGAVLSIFTGASGENLPWRKLEQALGDKLSGQDADRQVKQKLAEFESRLESYIVSPELEADIAELKQDTAIGGTFAALRDELAWKLLEFLEDELVWQIVREQILPGIRVFLQLHIRRNRDSIVAGLDLPGRIRESILGLKPENVHKLVSSVSGEELGMLQLLGFVLGGFAGLLLGFAQ
ncbi:MAG: DUF445 family protein [Lentisphaeria bacterium]|nr:DUF445 family protein [Lentisphaeria bacterium]